MNTYNSKPASGLYAALIFLLGAMPVSIMLSQTGPSGIYYAALAIAILILFKQKCNGCQNTHRHYKWLFAATAAPTIVVLFAALWNGFLSGRDLETNLRFLMGTWLFILALRYVSQSWAKHAIWGYLLAALAASYYIISLSWPTWERPNTGTVYNAVGYGNLTLLLATLSFFSIRWDISSWPRTERIIKLLITIIAFAAFVLTQTRTAWLAMPVFLVIGATLFTSQPKPKRVLALSVIFIGLMSAFYISNDTLKERAISAYSQVVECQGAGRHTESSLCIRLQLWRASIDMLSERPVAGTGDKKKFRETMQNESLPKGIVTPRVSLWGEPHNDVMLALATFGWPGGIALLLAYIVPAVIFTRRMSFKNTIPVRTAAALGLAVCTGFIIFGIGETMLRGMRTVAFYAMSVALFMHLSYCASNSDK